MGLQDAKRNRFLFLSSVLLCSALPLHSCGENSETADSSEQQNINDSSFLDTGDDLSITDETETTSGNQKSVEFTSKLRPEKSRWIWDSTYTDTLTFIEFNGNYDYEFAKFKTPEGAKVNIYTHKFIEEELKGSAMLVKWKLDTFYLAGESDEPYLAEQLISTEVLGD